MWADINGERKKVACGPCIRGHRSSKCDHRDRVLVEVRKPGRPLSSCPHPSGSCSCERVVINYTIPKTSECACPSERAQAAGPASGNSSRVQKRNRKSTNTFTPASLEKAIKASQDAEIDSSSLLTRTPTNPSFAPSENSASNGSSAVSSASSTPRILPSPSRKQSYNSDVHLQDALSIPPVSDCCKPRPTSREAEPTQQQKGGSCCSGKAVDTPKPVLAPKKSCCSSSKQPEQVDMFSQMNGQPGMGQAFAALPQYHRQGQLQNQPFGGMHPGFNFGMSGNMGTSVPYGFNTPIFNHMAPGYQPPVSMPIPATPHGLGQNGSHTTEHNCHCGESCSCFGCAAHPHNATMTEYIRLMDQYMRTGGFGAMPPPTYDLPSYPHQAGFGAEINQGMVFHNNQSTNFSPLLAGQMALQTNINAMMGVPSTSVNVSSPWSQFPMQSPTQTPAAHDDHYFNVNSSAADRPTELKIEDSTDNSAVVDSPNEGRDEETPTLSPSSYLWQELVLPGCSDATGTCQCGDGCDCVGCLTHGGHNNVRLQSPVVTPHDGFDEFMTNNEAHGNGTSHGTYMTSAYSEAPS